MYIYAFSKLLYGMKILQFASNRLDKKLTDFNFTEAQFHDQYVMAIYSNPSSLWILTLLFCH